MASRVSLAGYVIKRHNERLPIWRQFDNETLYLQMQVCRVQKEEIVDSLIFVNTLKVSETYNIMDGSFRWKCNEETILERRHYY